MRRIAWRRACLGGLVCLAVALPARSQPKAPAPAPPSAAAAQQTLGQADPEGASGFEPKPLVRAKKHMIVAAHPLAAEAGRRVLREGGSAADAAIAAQLALNVVEPQSSGIGGGGFALTWRAADKQLTAWDGRETAPAAARPDLFLQENGKPLPFLKAATSGLSVGAPGLPRLLEALHKEGGRLPWPRLFNDAIRLADEGFPVSKRLHASITLMAPRLREDPDARAVFFDADGAPLAIGATLRQPALAESLRAMAKGGADAFYAGPIAEAIVRSVRAAPRPGALTKTDLAAYRAIRRQPVCLLYRARHRVCGMPPPSSGGATSLQILGMMERSKRPAKTKANIAKNGVASQAALRAHLFLEASRLAYADRNRYLADPAHLAQPLAGMLTPSYLAKRASLIDPEAPGVIPAPPGAPDGAPPLKASGSGADAPGTTHLSVIDAQGDIVSLTSSIEISFGAARMAGGFLLNNQLTDFSFYPEVDGAPVANAPGPGKRPRSSMAPTIVFDAQSNRPTLALGSPGGSRIIEYVAWALVGLLDEGLDPSEAASRPHLSHRNRLPTLEARPEAEALAQALRSRGHALFRAPLTSGLHILEIHPEGGLSGGADPRREGVALGD